MDDDLKNDLERYFKGAKKLKPNVFVLVRDNHVVEPLIDAKFSEHEPSTLIMPDYQEIFEGDILVYPTTRQFCYVDDIRHITGKGVYFVHYHTKYQLKPQVPLEVE